MSNKKMMKCIETIDEQMLMALHEAQTADEGGLFLCMLMEKCVMFALTMGADPAFLIQEMTNMIRHHETNILAESEQDNVVPLRPKVN